MALWEVERRDNILIASYNNPPMNYMVGDAMQEMRNLIPTFADPSVRVVILQGGPKGLFITHFSVENLVTMRTSGLLDDNDYTMFQFGKDYWFMLEQLEKPVICAMTGSTMGGGFETALGCDIRIAEQGDYQIGLPESRLGILPGGAGLTRMTRLFGASKAINMILRGQVFTPDEALAQGLVHEVASDARSRALEIARDLAALSPVAMKSIKHAIYQGEELPLEEALTLESKGFYDCMVTDEALKEMQDYVETPFEDRKAFLRPNNK
jgi:enoyl-CoA hydratase